MADPGWLTQLDHDSLILLLAILRQILLIFVKNAAILEALPLFHRLFDGIVCL